VSGVGASGGRGGETDEIYANAGIAKVADALTRARLRATALSRRLALHGEPDGAPGRILVGEYELKRPRRI
jgi:hypothetical protein